MVADSLHRPGSPCGVHDTRDRARILHHERDALAINRLVLLVDVVIGSHDFDRSLGVEARERVEAMKAIWTQDEAEYHGELVDFDPIYMWPKPIQKPHPPIHVGGGFPGGARRAIRYGDGWMPIGGRDGDIAERLSQFRELAREAGRDPKALEVSIFAAEPNEAALARHRDAGISRVVLMLPPAPRDEILPILDTYASLMNSVG